MIEAIITLLIYLCVLAIVIYLIIFVLQTIGVPLPGKVIQLLWVIVALVAILLILRILLPRLGAGNLLGTTVDSMFMLT